MKKKTELKTQDDMLPEYDFSGKKGIRGKYYEAYRQGHTVKIHLSDVTMKHILISTSIGAICGAICGFFLGILLGYFIIGLAALYYWFIFGVLYGAIPGAVIGAFVGWIRA